MHTDTHTHTHTFSYAEYINGSSGVLTKQRLRIQARTVYVRNFLT